MVGPLPMEVGNSKSLETLIVSENRLSGEIPTTLDNCYSLRCLYMKGNYFQGVVPPLGSIKGLIAIDFAHNNFSGWIPDYIKAFPDLLYLNLSYNDFEGEVPQEGIFKNANAISLIGNKRLCGGTPKLLLPTCPDHSTKKRRSLAPRVMISIVAGSILCLVLLLSLFVALCHWMRKSKNRPSTTHDMEDQFLNVSHAALCEATDGFSSTNLIGTESYGSVYKGSLDCIETTVAVKVLNLQRRGAYQSFTAECKALRNIRRRNLIKILTVCSSIDFKDDDFKALVF